MSSVKQLDRHPEYYIKGGDLYIVVAHTIFRVHAFFFQRESQRFRDIMAAPVPGASGQLRQGETDTAAIIIKDVSVEHFAKFLWVFYNPVFAVYNATLLEWIAILKLAHEYQFPEVKRLAIRELENFEIPISERIALYQSHAVEPVYLVPLYVKLCMRDEGPTDEETTTMGIKTSLIIFRARERLHFRPLSGSKDRSLPNENDITRTIYSLLGFDYNGQIGLVPLRRETRDVGRIRGAGEASTCDQAVVLENVDTNLGDAEEDPVVAAQEDCRDMEIQKGLIVVGAREVSTTKPSRCHFSLVNSTHSTGANLTVAIFLVVSARTFVLLFALSWTFLLFFIIRDFPSHLRIL